jgi:bacterioferritin-associated ferredoxin
MVNKRKFFKNYKCKCDNFSFTIQFFHSTGPPMIVCVCHRVSDKEIHHHASEGKSFEDIQIDLGVATQCGRCEDCARDVVERCHANATMVHGAWKTITMTRHL